MAWGQMWMAWKATQMRSHQLERALVSVRWSLSGQERTRVFWRPARTLQFGRKGVDD